MRRPSIPARVKDCIFYYYAKLVIAPAAGEKGNYRFVMDRYKRLRSGSLLLSSFDRELDVLREASGCAFCGQSTDLQPTTVVPSDRGGPMGIHNTVMACQSCMSGRGGEDLVVWWLSRPGENLDTLPRLPIGLYLKIAFEMHQVNFSLDSQCERLWDLFPKIESR